MYSAKAGRFVEKKLSKFKIAPENLERCERNARGFLSFLLNSDVPEVKVEYRRPSEVPAAHRNAVGIAYPDLIIMNAGKLFLGNGLGNHAITPLVQLTSHLVHEHTHVHDQNSALGRRKNLLIRKYRLLLPVAKTKGYCLWVGMFGSRPKLSPERAEQLAFYRDMLNGCTDMAEARAFRIELQYLRHALRAARECYWDEGAHEYLCKANPGYYSLLSAYLALEKEIGFEGAWKLTRYVWFRDHREAWEGAAFAERVLNTSRISKTQLEGMPAAQFLSR